MIKHFIETNTETIAEYLLSEGRQVLVLLDRKGIVQDCNDGLVRLLELPEKPLGKHITQLTSPGEDRQLICPASGERQGVRLRLQGSGGTSQTISGALVGGEDGCLLYGETFTLTHSEALARVAQLNSELTNLTHQLHEKTRTLQLANKQVAQLANQDALTGVASRRYFFESLDRWIAFARRQSLPLSVMMADLDHFKTINDSWGHDAGDEVLRAVGRTLRSLTREEDLVGRFGGEEFILFLPRASAAGEGVTCAERIRSLVSELSFERVHKPVTVSVGVTDLRQDDTLDALVKRADLALYDAKHDGRNCTAIR